MATQVLGALPASASQPSNVLVTFTATSLLLKVNVTSIARCSPFTFTLTGIRTLKCLLLCLIACSRLTASPRAVAVFESFTCSACLHRQVPSSHRLFRSHHPTPSPCPHRWLQRHLRLCSRFVERSEEQAACFVIRHFAKCGPSRSK